MATHGDISRRVSRRSSLESTPVTVVLAGVALAVGGWIGLFWLVTNTFPIVPNRWAFYALLQITLTGTALPFVHFLQRRFTRQGRPPVTHSVLVRQATWVGLFFTTCVWLRIPRLLSLPLVLLIALALTAIEYLLRARERMQIARP